MKNQNNKNSPIPLLVSVVIPCYNYGIYLPEAIDSIKKQTYPNIEIIVIDDGSTDNTKEVATNFSSIKYYFQQNQGLSAARNAGTKCSNGEMILFLDADDVLYPDAIEYNVNILQKNPSIAFVSGAHHVSTIEKRILSVKKQIILEDHYLNLLMSNYIGMHATVLYRRWVFNEYEFNTSLKACEDYDLYLSIARIHPVIHHIKELAMYRLHDKNMSKDTKLMLKSALTVLNHQMSFLVTNDQKAAYLKGIKGWEEYYNNNYLHKLKKKIAVRTRLKRFFLQNT